MIRAHTQFQKSMGVIIIAATLSVSSFFAWTLPQAAHAVDSVTVVGGPGTFWESVTAANTAKTAASQTSLAFKEFTLDNLAWVAAKMIVKGIIRNTINWINSGFRGSPAYVTDLEGFLLDVVDREIGNYIYGTDLGFLCSPFELQIRLALASRFKGHRDEIVCRLSDIVNNVNNFIGGGDFSQGGWDAWFVLTVDDNPYNRYLQASNQLDIRIANARGEQIKLLDWGEGFHSWEECNDVYDSGSGETHRMCKIATPGSFIKDQLNVVAGSQIAGLVEADEINELIGALASQLVVQVMGGSSGGLSGLSRSYSNQSSYLDRLNSEIITPQPVSQTQESNPLVAQEMQYRNVVSSALDQVQQSATYALQLNSCSPGRGDAFIASSIQGFRNELNSKIAVTDQNIAMLRSIDIRLANANTTEQVNDINLELARITQSGMLHDQVEFNQELARKENLSTAMSQINLQVQNELASCNQQNNSNNNGGSGDGGAGGAL